MVLGSLSQRGPEQPGRRAVPASCARRSFLVGSQDWRYRRGRAPVHPRYAPSSRRSNFSTLVDPDLAPGPGFGIIEHQRVHARRHHQAWALTPGPEQPFDDTTQCQPVDWDENGVAEGRVHGRIRADHSFAKRTFFTEDVDGRSENIRYRYLVLMPLSSDRIVGKSVAGLVRREAPREDAALAVDAA